MSMPLVSVIIPCFNAEPWIRETVGSVMAQHSDNTELIVIDDGSTDRGGQVVQTEFPSARVVRTARQGPCRARDLGTELSTGQFIQYLDADDLLAEGKLARQIEALERSGADVAYGGWQELQSQEDGSFRLGKIVDRQIQHTPEIELFTDFWCPPGTYLFRRKIVEQVGGWNERIPNMADARFALDCALQGGHFIYCPGIMGYYRVHGNSLSRQDPITFVRHCFRNAIEIETWWEEHGGVDEERRKALLKVYGYIARASFKKDPLTFETAYRVLERLQPGYIPAHPRHLALASRVLGYRGAESLAFWYRKAKSLLRNASFAKTR